MSGRVIHMPSARANLLVALVPLLIAGCFFMGAQPVSSGPLSGSMFQPGPEIQILNRTETTGRTGSLHTIQAESAADVSSLTGVDDFCDSVTEIPLLECQALVALYNSTNGAGWTNRNGWLATNTPCSWYGVSCSAGHVDVLHLWSNHLSGSIPSELGNLANLQDLSLWGNQLSGSIPPQLGNLANLQALVLSSNQLSGSIPPELGNLANLQGLFLDNNQLSGSIPSDLGNLYHLELLRLGFNQLSGSIPPELGNLANLYQLYLEYNQLSGSIPSELGDLANLWGLDLSSNQLSGSIPARLGNLVNLQNLWLNANQLSGSIPPQLGNLANLEALVLSSNQLSGSIPPELGNLANLRELDLSANQLGGSIPSQLGNLANLQWLKLNGNQPSGGLPQSLKNLPLDLFYFDNTNLCEPGDPAFQAWLAGIAYLQRTGAICTLALSKDAQPGAGGVGARLTYTLTLRNMMAGTPINSVVLTDTLPVSVTLLGGSPPPTNQAGHVLRWDVGTLPAGGSYTVTVEVTLPATPGRILNQANTTGQAGSPLTTQAQFTTDVFGVISVFDCSTVIQIPQTECNALVALYNSTNGAGWKNNRDWLATDTPCSWYGVSCTPGHVRLLNLNSNQMSGSIPPELGNLADLDWLWLNDNQLSGSIPPELGNLAHLGYLDLSSNQLSGSIPPELGNRLTDLNQIYLNNNQLSGSIPPELGNLVHLQVLFLHSNQLSGSIPPQLGRLTWLTFLYLYSNQLSGSIPPELGDMARIEDMRLYSNQLSGSIPPQLGTLTHLWTLDLHNNQLSGSIPPEFGTLYSLGYLSLGTNQLSGSIGSELGNLFRLISLDLGSNQLSGSISQLVGAEGDMQYLDLSFNQLSGSIPPQLGARDSLQYLDLSSNQWSGSIPQELGNLTNLQSLWLDDNSLSGGLPQSLTGLHMTDFSFENTQLCEPGDPAFQAWLAGIGDLRRTNVICRLALSKDAQPSAGIAGTGLTYTLTLSNMIAGTALSSIVLTDTLPVSVTLLSADPPATSQAGHVLQWDVGTLPVGGSYTVTVGVTLPATPGRVLNQASATGQAGSLLTTQAQFTTDVFDSSGAGDFCTDVTEIPKLECQALVALYNDTNGAGWSTNSGWLATDTPCSWFGVSCTAGHVTSIELRWNQLSGNIAPELGNLVNLTALSLDYNYNGLSGSIPSELGNLANLQYLSLYTNGLSGSIPLELGNLANLRSLVLEGNQLSGSIPPELGNLANLGGLYLGSNQLSGSITPELGNLASLGNLGLEGNQLSGSIPSQLGNLANLRGLSLYSNQLSGSIPPELGNLANLGGLYLNSNQLSGSIPPELGNLVNLQTLYLNSNGLSGSIPPQLGNLANLRELYLYSNHLSGSIPPELGALANLQTLWLDGNQLSGSIPPELGALANLQSLYLDGNQLSGGIPPQLGNLANLQYLYLEQNPLSGDLPQSLTGLHLMDFSFSDTLLCEPGDPAFQAWLAGVSTLYRSGILCISGVAIDGPSTGFTGQSYLFSALVSPISATLPITYTWEAAGQTTILHGSLAGITDSAAFTWPSAGQQVITVTAANLSNAVTGVYTITIADAPATYTVTVAPSSPATITLPNDRGQVSLPDGLVTTTTTFTYTELLTPTQTAGGFAFAGRSFTLEATDAAGQPVTSFSTRYTITLNYQDADWQAAGIPAEENLYLYYWNGAAWVAILPCAGCSLDTVNNKIVAVLDHLTEFALLGNPLATPAISAQKMSNGVKLTWVQIGSNMTGYEVYRSTNPYFTADASNKLGDALPPGPGNLASYPDETAYSPPWISYFYIVRAAGTGGTVSSSSNRVGAFHFALTPGGQ